MSKIGIVFCFVAIVMQCGIAEKMHAAEENVEETLGKYNEENDFTTGLFKSKRAMLIWQKASRTEVLPYTCTLLLDAAICVSACWITDLMEVDRCSP